MIKPKFFKRAFFSLELVFAFEVAFELENSDDG